MLLNYSTLTRGFIFQFNQFHEIKDIAFMIEPKISDIIVASLQDHFQALWLSPVCTNMWDLIILTLLNFLAHCPHLCGINPLWAYMCILILSATLNLFEHCWQMLNYSSVCTDLCFSETARPCAGVRSLLKLDFFSPACVLICVLRVSTLLHE